MPTEAEVIERIKVFYAPDTAEGIRKDCDKWLQNMRKEHGAWEILNSLVCKRHMIARYTPETACVYAMNHTNQPNKRLLVALCTPLRVLLVSHVRLVAAVPCQG
eukprot:TRINITY_DN3584_c0_g2_i1.p1 TRINITY_DN3584_c0_g2~~TRINITY_DN3584_c0_g2_i1.p1  ORF type:complete len:104 (+),score=4.95 TRINITY_DN3584_c0_g2_i1:132-443(+)